MQQQQVYLQRKLERVTHILDEQENAMLSEAFDILKKSSVPSTLLLVNI